MTSRISLFKVACLGVVASWAQVGLARGAPREALTFAGVTSWGEAGDIHNVLAERTLLGGYGVGSVRVSGALRALATGTFASDARLYVSAPDAQGSLIVQPFAQGAFTGTLTVDDVRFAASEGWATSGGVWRVRFYELVSDSQTGPDAIWDSISVVLDDEPLDPPATLVPVAGEFFEIEGNSSKARANRVEGLSIGERITGTSTGSAASGSADDSSDYFRVETLAASSGVYRHRLTLASGTPGQSVSLRGLTQSNGFLAPGSDTAVQSASVASLPPSFVQWFGFGQQERVMVRVSGTSSTTQPYTLTYSRAPITPVDLGAFVGDVTVSTQGLTGIDTDLWIYDSQFRPVPGAGNDDGVVGPNSPRQSVLSRRLSAGEYYLALGDFNLANDQASPADDLSRNGPVLEFPGAVVNSSVSTSVPLQFSMEDSLGRRVVTPATKPGSFEVLFYRFEVSELCVADRTGPGGVPDGAVTIDDLLSFLDAFEAGAITADIDDGHGGGVLDGAVTIDDLLFFLTRFEAGC